MSRETNKGVMMSSKAITANLLAVVGLIVELGTCIEKPNVSPEVYIYIS